MPFDVILNKVIFPLNAIFSHQNMAKQISNKKQPSTKSIKITDVIWNMTQKYQKVN